MKLKYLSLLFLLTLMLSVGSTVALADECVHGGHEPVIIVVDESTGQTMCIDYCNEPPCGDPPVAGRVLPQSGPRSDRPFRFPIHQPGGSAPFVPPFSPADPLMP